MALPPVKTKKVRASDLTCGMHLVLNSDNIDVQVKPLGRIIDIVPFKPAEPNNYRDRETVEIHYFIETGKDRNTQGTLLSYSTASLAIVDEPKKKKTGTSTFFTKFINWCKK